MLDEQNSKHLSVSVVRDQVLAIVDPDVSDVSQCRPMTPTEVLQAAGFDHPTNAQAKECATLLRGWFGEPRRIQGRDRWRVPLRAEVDASPAVRPESRKSKFD